MEQDGLQCYMFALSMAITHKGYYRNTELVPGPSFHSPELQLTNTIAERERNKSQKNPMAQLGIDWKIIVMD